MAKTIVKKDSVMVKFRYYVGGEGVAEEHSRYFYGQDGEANVRRAQEFIDNMDPAPDWYEIIRLRKTSEVVGGSRAI